MLVLPKTDAITRLLSNLIGRAVTARPGTPPTDPLGLAIYVNDSDTTVAIGTYDISLAASLGAALTMIPADVAKSAVRVGKITESCLENFYEVANVSASLLSTVGAHVKLKEIMFSPSASTAPIVEQINKCNNKVSLELTVTGYLNGKMGLFGL